MLKEKVASLQQLLLDKESAPNDKDEENEEIDEDEDEKDEEYEEDEMSCAKSQTSSKNMMCEI